MGGGGVSWGRGRGDSVGRESNHTLATNKVEYSVDPEVLWKALGSRVVLSISYKILSFVTYICPFNPSTSMSVMYASDLKHKYMFG